MNDKIMRRYVYLFLLIVCVVSVSLYTLCYVQDRSVSISNSFIASSYVDIEVEESFSGTLKSDIGIENTGTQNSYVRMKIMVQVVDILGNVVSNPTFYNDEGNITELDVTCEDLLIMEYDGVKTYNEEDWILVNDIYYYKYSLEVGEITSYVYDEIKQNETFYLYNIMILENIFLIKVTILAQAIELDGVSVWDDVEVLEDGTLSSIGGN